MGSGGAVVMKQAGALIGLIAGGLFLCMTPAHADGTCDPNRIELRAGGQGAQAMAQFRVEIADTAAERAKGLMFREDMATSAGMLFVYESPQHAVFWMENTPLPLDMIFADAAGRVTHVHRQAQPFDRTPIDGGEGVRFVLEINGGLAERMGIEPGTELRHPAIPAASAAWPCN